MNETAAQKALNEIMRNIADNCTLSKEMRKSHAISQIKGQAFFQVFNTGKTITWRSIHDEAWRKLEGSADNHIES